MPWAGTASLLGRLSLLFAALVLLAVGAGCGGGGSSDASAEQSVPIPDSPPKLEVPEALPPKKIVIEDLSEGTGKEAEKGDQVSLHYYCIIWETGAEYANSWRYPSVPIFVLGKHQLLRGLNIAVSGMKEGGAREVLIPNTLVHYPESPQPTPRRLGALICKTYLVDLIEPKARS